MTQNPYAAFKVEHRNRLDLAIAQFIQGLNDDPYEVLERAGAANRLIDLVAERAVFRVLARGDTVQDAMRALDGWTVVFVESDGPLSDDYMRGRVNTWIQGWRRRLEKLQRETPYA